MIRLRGIRVQFLSLAYFFFYAVSRPVFGATQLFIGCVIAFLFIDKVAGAWFSQVNLVPRLRMYGAKHLLFHTLSLRYV